ncbi:MAG: zinc ribbon domain-containing protein [Oscillospiraceae bacterium]|nr:zinc ribbon domain-containing protein [Oscillospiraceae bacterium]
MANCKNCGTALREGARFCAQCGTAVVMDIFCSACGEKLEAGDRFCIYCGTKVGAAAPAPAPAPAVKCENEYPAWQNFAALCDVGNMITVGAGSPDGHYLTGRTDSRMLRVDAEGTAAEYISNPEGVLGFYSKQWKNGRLWLSAFMARGDSGSLHRLYTYTPADGFNVALDISGEEYGDLDIVRFIVTESCIFLFCFNSKRKENNVSLMTCSHEGGNLRELWRGEDFLLCGAGLDKLYMICQDDKGRRVLVVSEDGTVENAADHLRACIETIAAGIGAAAGETSEERGDFCWKHIPFIDFVGGVVYVAKDAGGTENLSRQVYSINISGGELKPMGEKWQLGDIDPTENFREYFDGEKAVGFTYGNPGGWTAVHSDGSRVYLGDGNYWDSGAVLGDYFYLDCCSSDPGTWYKISLRDGSRRKLTF